MDEKQEQQDNKDLTIDDKLFKVKYTPDEETHLMPNPQECLVCKSKVCTIVCPAKVYEWNDEDKKLSVGHENCLECGACRIVCERKCIEWSYPKGNKGVTFKQG